MQSVGMGDPLLASSIQYIIIVMMTLPAILLLDRVSSRRALLFGSLGMMIWFFINGALQGAYGHAVEVKTDSDVSWVIDKEHRAVSKAIVALSYLFIATLACTWGPVSWTYPLEIFPSKIRAKAVSLATASNWAWNTVLAFAVPRLLVSANWKMYMVFGAFNGLALIHMFFAVPETKGRSLEEMEEIFDSGIPAWRTRALEMSRVDRLRQDIEAGTHKVGAPEESTVLEVPKHG